MPSLALASNQRSCARHGHLPQQGVSDLHIEPPRACGVRGGARGTGATVRKYLRYFWFGKTYLCWGHNIFYSLKIFQKTGFCDSTWFKASKFIWIIPLFLQKSNWKYSQTNAYIETSSTVWVGDVRYILNPKQLSIITDIAIGLNADYINISEVSTSCNPQCGTKDIVGRRVRFLWADAVPKKNPKGSSGNILHI